MDEDIGFNKLENKLDVEHIQKWIEEFNPQ